MSNHHVLPYCVQSIEKRNGVRVGASVVGVWCLFLQHAVDI